MTRHHHCSDCQAQDPVGKTISAHSALNMGRLRPTTAPQQASRRAGPTLKRSVFKKAMGQLDPTRGQLQALGAAER